MDTQVNPQSEVIAPAALREVLSKDEQLMKLQNERIAALIAENTALKANQPKQLEKREATKEEFATALKSMVNTAEADLASGNPRLGPATSLAEILKFQPVLTDEQKQEYYPAKKALIVRYSNFHLNRAAVVKKDINKLLDKPGSIVGTVMRDRKDGTAAMRKLQVSEAKRPTKVNGHGKDAAKPAQVAAKVPAAGNAANPAKL